MYEYSREGYADCHHGICFCDNFNDYFCDNCGFVWYGSDTDHKNDYDKSIQNITPKQIIHYTVKKDSRSYDNSNIDIFYESQITLINDIPRAIQMFNKLRVIIGFRSLNGQIEIFTSYFDRNISKCVYKKQIMINNLFSFSNSKNELTIVDSYKTCSNIFCENYHVEIKLSLLRNNHVPFYSSVLEKLMKSLI